MPLNSAVHKNIILQILIDIYSDTTISPYLGFKGGTAAMLFYELPRFSVDLDFDLLDPGKKAAVFERLKEILPRFGVLTEGADKQYTLFFVLNYRKGERNLKIEISKRPSHAEFVLKHY